MFDWYKHTEEMARKVKKAEFVLWVREFKTIGSKQIDAFLCEIDEELSFHEMKCKFSEKYQDRITFSYFLGVENKIVKDLHIEKIEGSGYGYSGIVFTFSTTDGYGIGDSYGDSVGSGCGYGHSFSINGGHTNTKSFGGYDGDNNCDNNYGESRIDGSGGEVT